MRTVQIVVSLGVVMRSSPASLPQIVDYSSVPLRHTPGNGLLRFDQSSRPRPGARKVSIRYARASRS